MPHDKTMANILSVYRGCPDTPVVEPDIEIVRDESEPTKDGHKIHRLSDSWSTSMPEPKRPKTSSPIDLGWWCKRMEQ
jgi:hypothetical protein